MLIESEKNPAAVLETAKQAGESRSFDWAELSIWTDRMLEALVKGVKGGVWFSGNIDHLRWPNKFFRENGLFSLSLVDAHMKLLQSSER